MSVIRVVAGVIVKDGTVLIAQRKDSHSQGGLWEFPGGKVEAGETDSIALVRELEEELDVIVSVRQSLGENTHHYPDKSICLCGYFCEMESGEMHLNSHQKVAWVEPAALRNYAFSAADLPFVSLLEKFALPLSEQLGDHDQRKHG